MSLFALGDLHLSLCGDKPMDIFDGWDGYVNKLRENWQKIVKREDTVVLAGDLSWAGDLDGFLCDARFIDALPGRKLVIKGNHDYWWTTMKKMNAFIERNGLTSLRIVHNCAVEVGDVCVCGTRGWFFDESAGADKKILLREAGRLEASLAAGAKTGKEPVVFLHFPPIYGSFECTELLGLLKKYGVRRCYYGHLHGKAAGRAVVGEYGGIFYRLVSCDAVGFTPVLVD